MPFAKAIGQAIFKAMAPELGTAASMIRAAKKYGGTYRKTEMLADIRKYTGRIKYETRIRALKGNTPVPRAWMSEVDLNVPDANYRIFGEANFYDWNTGTDYQQTVSFYHTDHMGKIDFATEFDNYFSGSYQEEDFELLSFEQTAQEHNIGKPY